MKVPLARWIVIVTAAAAVIVVIGLAVTPNAAPPDADQDEFTGRWIVTGTDPRGVEYAGTLVISADGDGYIVRWIVTGGVRLGSASRAGDELVAEWVQGEGIEGALRGTARIAVDGEVMTSVVTIDGVPGMGTETGSPAR